MPQFGSYNSKVTEEDGNLNVPSLKVITLGVAPASAVAPGVEGDIVITATHIYVCSATDTWVRAALATW